MTIDAPDCPEGCGPFLSPTFDHSPLVTCAACGERFDLGLGIWNKAEDALNDYYEEEDRKQKAADLAAQPELDRQKLADWEKWSEQHKGPDS